MANAISSKQILKAIGCNNLELFRCVGHGYWYFAYTGKADDGSMIYDTKSIYCVRLNDMALNRWVEDGIAFVKEMGGVLK